MSKLSIQFFANLAGPYSVINNMFDLDVTHYLPAIPTTGMLTPRCANIGKLHLKISKSLLIYCEFK